MRVVLHWPHSVDRNALLIPAIDVAVLLVALSAQLSPQGILAVVASVHLAARMLLR